MELTPEGWHGILDPGERILWQGRPDGGLDVRRETLAQAASGLPLLVFGIVWFSATVGIRDGGFVAALFPLLGLGMMAAGLWQTIGTFAMDAWRRRHTWYTLTDRRAFVATDLFGRKVLRDWPIDAETLLDFDGAEPGTIWFAESWTEGRRRGRTRIGFERIEGARRVHEEMRRVQRRQA